MDKIIINPDIDLSILEEIGFEKRYSELTGKLQHYMDIENVIQINITERTIKFGVRQFTFEQEAQLIKILELYDKNIIILKKEEGDEK